MAVAFGCFFAFGLYLEFVFFEKHGAFPVGCRVVKGVGIGECFVVKGEIFYGIYRSDEGKDGCGF